MRYRFLLRRSSKAIGIVVTAIIFFVVAWQTETGLLYYMVAFLISLLIASMATIMFQILFGAIKVIRNTRGTAVEGYNLTVGLSVVNNGTFTAHNLEIEDNFTPRPPTTQNPIILIRGLLPGKAIDVDYQQECYMRGSYMIGPIIITHSDAFGLFFISQRLEVLTPLLVYTQTFMIKELPKLAGGGRVSWYGIETAHISGDEHEFYGIREYQPEDPIKNIHWRSSARLQKLVVQQFERCSETQVTIALDLMKENNIGSGKETTLEYSIKIAASLAKYLIGHKHAIQFLAHGRHLMHLPFDKGAGQLSRIEKILAAVEAEGEVPLTQLLAEATPLIPAHSVLLLLMLDRDLAGLNKAVELMTKNISLRPFVIYSDSFVHFERADTIREEIRSKQLAAFSSAKITPHFFCCGDNLEKRFLEVVK